MQRHECFSTVIEKGIEESRIPISTHTQTQIGVAVLGKRGARTERDTEELIIS